MHQNFLTDEQKKAIDYTKNTWVTASAGSGKTRVLIERIRAIKNNRAGKVLCLAFTNAAAKEMEGRIADTDDIIIDTIHGFSTKIIKKFHDMLSLPSEIIIFDEKKMAEAVSDAYDMLLATKEMHQYFISLSDIYSEKTIKKHLISLFQKKASIKMDPARNKEFIDSILPIDGIFDKDFSEEYINMFITASCTPRKRPPSGMDKEKFQIQQAEVIQYIENRNKKYIHDITDNYARLLFAMHKNYISIKKDALDFDDIILSANHLLHAHECMGEVLLYINRNVGHVLVDEAQDISALQWNIIKPIGEIMASQNGKSLFVVGDPKQSIYSFQGADPAEFLAAKSFFQNCAMEFGMPWQNVTLSVSFRSAQEILSYVDNVFSKIKLCDEPYMQHTSRKEDTGIIDICKFSSVERDHDYWGQSYVTEENAPEKVYANDILQYIQGLLKRYDPQDIMVLFQKRDALFDCLIKTLDRAGIPVSCKDKVCIFQETAIEDLIFLARCMMCPHDDASLAIVLKSPIFGSNEEFLFELAYDRGNKTLWDALCGHRYREIMETWRNLYFGHGLFHFFNEVIRCTHANIIARLGKSAASVLDIFLEIVRDFEDIHGHSISRLIEYTEKKNDLVAKRSTSHCADCVRVMTAHSAKGFESKVVIIADTNRPAQEHDDFLVAAGNFIWAPPRQYDMQEMASIKGILSAQNRQEHMRLLYVAMTRAMEVLCFFAPDKECRTGWRALFSLE